MIFLGVVGVLAGLIVAFGAPNMLIGAGGLILAGAGCYLTVKSAIRINRQTEVEVAAAR